MSQKHTFTVHVRLDGDDFSCAGFGPVLQAALVAAGVKCDAAVVSRWVTQDGIKRHDTKKPDIDALIDDLMDSDAESMKEDVTEFLEDHNRWEEERLDLWADAKADGRELPDVEVVA